MKYKLYKLWFSTAVHFGKGKLGSSDSRLLADSIFSAVCSEAAEMIGKEEIEFLVESAKGGKLLLSDSMPFIGDELFIPKPVVSFERSADESDSVLKKEFKKLSFIPVSQIPAYFEGQLDATEINKKLSGLGVFSEKTCAAIHEGEDALPYNIGTFTFSSDCGLYFIIGYDDDEIFYHFDDIMYSLGYTGIGGKVSSGLGKFEARIQDVPPSLLEMLNGNSDFDAFITLSVCMADKNEIGKAVDGAEYTLVKRSGFVNSLSYSDTFRKRRDFYCFAGGSSFKNRFDGDVFDLADGGSHPVYRYAKPMFMGVKI